MLGRWNANQQPSPVRRGRFNDYGSKCDLMPKSGVEEIMNRENRGILVGMVYGDGYLHCGWRKSGDHKIFRQSLVIVHSDKQHDYCVHKAKLVKTILKRTCRVVQGVNNKKYRCSRFSVSHPYCKTLWKKMYSDGKKRFTRQCLDMLTDHGLAIWYLDDGHTNFNVNIDGYITSVYMQLATMCSKEEINILKDYFNEVHNLFPTIRCDNRSNPWKKYFLQFKTDDSITLTNIIKPYVIESMSYKINPIQNLLSHERQAPIAVCKDCGRDIYKNTKRGYCPTCYVRNLRKNEAKI